MRKKSQYTQTQRRTEKSVGDAAQKNGGRPETINKVSGLERYIQNSNSTEQDDWRTTANPRKNDNNEEIDTGVFRVDYYEENEEMEEGMIALNVEIYGNNRKNLSSWNVQ